MTSSQFVGDIDMETITPTNSSIMLECNRAREEFGSSKRLKGIEEINEKKQTYAEPIHVDEVQKDNNYTQDNLWRIVNTLLSDIVKENKNEAKECTDEDVHMCKLMLRQFCDLLMYSMIVQLYYFVLGNTHS